MLFIGLQKGSSQSPGPPLRLSIALFADAVAEAVWHHQLLLELHRPIERATIV
jgi:hypothetical protein